MLSRGQEFKSPLGHSIASEFLQIRSPGRCHDGARKRAGDTAAILRASGQPSAARRSGRPPGGPCRVDVLVDGERDHRVGVTEALRDRLDRLAGGQQQDGLGVAQVVQPDPRQLVLPQRPARRNACSTNRRE